MPRKSTTLYGQAVDITREYLGPAADRFISRQIENHLHKKPENLKKGDLKDLLVWINLAMNVLIADRSLVEDYLQKLNRLMQ
jgi:hypothetical protein